MWAVLGEILFSFLDSPRSLEAELGYHFAEHKVVESYPVLQWIAPELQTLTIDILLHTSFAKPTARLAEFEAAALDHQARALVYGNGIHAGYFVIQKISKTYIQTADDGSIIALGLKLSLKQQVKSFDPSAPPQPAAPPPAVAQTTTTSTPAFDPSTVFASSAYHSFLLPPPGSAPGYTPPTFPPGSTGTSAITNNTPASGPTTPDFTSVPPQQIVRAPA